MKGDKKTKRNMLATEYEFSCLYMLIYLCINEVLREN